MGVMTGDGGVVGVRKRWLGWQWATRCRAGSQGVRRWGNRGGIMERFKGTVSGIVFFFGCFRDASGSRPKSPTTARHIMLLPTVLTAAALAAPIRVAVTGAGGQV